jgi:hypothetical protein
MVGDRTGDFKSAIEILNLILPKIFSLKSPSPEE